MVKLAEKLAKEIAKAETRKVYKNTEKYGIWWAYATQWTNIQTKKSPL